MTVQLFRQRDGNLQHAVAETEEQEKSLREQGYKPTEEMWAAAVPESHLKEIASKANAGAGMERSKQGPASGDDSPDFAAMTKAEIAAYADETHGLKLDLNAKKDELVAAVKKAEEDAA